MRWPQLLPRSRAAPRKAAPAVPWESGFGRERREAGIPEFTTTRNVMINYPSEAPDPFAIRN